MSLLIRLPLDGNLKNLGLLPSTITNFGATINTDGKTGSCYSFDGSNDYISLTNLGTVFTGGTNPFSISFWMYHNGNARRGVIFGNYGLADNGGGFNLEITASNQLRFWWQGNPKWIINASNFTIATQTWYHVTIVYDGSKEYLYINGVLKESYSLVLPSMSATSNWYLGRDSRTGATAFYGKLNEFKIYNHALSTKEILENYRTLILHYKFDDPFVSVNPNLFKNISSVSPRTLKYGNGFKFLTVTGDAYVGVALSTTLVSGTTYTISYDVELSAGDKTQLGFFYSSAMNHVVWLQNGHMSYLFTPTTNLSSITLDDSKRSNSNPIIISNIKIELGSTETKYIPYGYTPPKNYYDSSGYERDVATVIGTPQIINNDQSRYALSMIMDGSTGFISKEFYTPSTCTYCFWTKISNTDSKFFIDARKSNVGVSPAYMSGTKFLVYSSTGGSNNHSITLPTDTWFHMAISLTLTTNKVYVDGVLKGSGVAAHGMNLLAPVTVGMRHSLATFMSGAINDVRMYAAELSADDIKDIMTLASLDDKGDLFCYEIVEDSSVKINKTGIVNSESINEETLSDKLASILSTGTFKVNQILEK